ncbi:L,D-transpeptidase scaffold domain-containing protein [Sabulicella rubraurantiaca]|uniref:L,D-transpeptidase family protein n=1 Tax=Sabulicella rubraurantiaca TaxID=2811429 RepID=UPI001A97CBEB|nr:L,D-transpeptidase family protein [Sabulicella rubraurantiaca]
MVFVHASGCNSEFGHQESATLTRSKISRRSAISGGPFALAAACALAACGSDPAPEPVLAAPRSTETGIDRLREGSPRLVVAGERLNSPLLRRFYARHGFEPVWTTRQAQADLLRAAVLRAGGHGLDPEMFHASALRRLSDLSQPDRDLVLSNAFLSYADALAHGAVPADRRRPGEDLRPEPVDIAATLDGAITRSDDPVAAIEALAPGNSAYLALREALQRHGTNASAGDPVSRNRLRVIEVNLERQRWLPRRLPADRVWVNVADQKLELYRADQPVFATRVVVGNEADHRQSPEFRATIEGSFFNPPWVVPRDIVASELLPRIQRDPNYLAKNNMVMLENGEVEQRPGPNTGVGAIMLDMPNRFDVYLHDTPAQYLFGRDNRRLSFGCIRVENPRAFTALLMEQTLEAIDQVIGTGVTTRRALPKPTPVFVIYQTAFVDAEGMAQFRPDFYNRDARIWQQLQRRPSAERMNTVS